MVRYADPELYELVSHLRSELSEQSKEMRALQVKNKQLQDEINESAFEIERLRNANLELLHVIGIAHDKISLAIENIQKSLGV